MENKSYHHGDLRNALLEAGIALLNEEGLKDFSLRKVAAKCGVSHTAPYSHFKNVEALRQAMGDYVTEQFTQRLLQSIQGESNIQKTITLLGEAYISFFEENSNYFQFLFYYSGVEIHLDDQTENIYEPFRIFKEAAYRAFASMGVNKDDYINNIIALWSMVHGIASLSTNQAIYYSGDWTKALTDNLFTGRKSQ